MNRDVKGFEKELISEIFSLLTKQKYSSEKIESIKKTDFDYMNCFELTNIKEDLLSGFDVSLYLGDEFSAFDSIYIVRELMHCGFTKEEIKINNFTVSQVNLISMGYKKSVNERALTCLA